MAIVDQDGIERDHIKIGGEVHVFWPPGDPEAERLITLRELVEYAARDGAAFEHFVRMKRLH